MTVYEAMAYHPTDLWTDDSYEKVSWIPKSDSKAAIRHHRRFYVRIEDDVIVSAAHATQRNLVSDNDRDQSSHILVLSLGFALAGLIAFGMLLSGLASENGFPLSYFAASMVLIGASFAFASEWWSRRAK